MDEGRVVPILPGREMEALGIKIHLRSQGWTSEVCTSQFPISQASIHRESNKLVCREQVKRNGFSAIHGVLCFPWMTMLPGRRSLPWDGFSFSPHSSCSLLLLFILPPDTNHSLAEVDSAVVKGRNHKIFENLTRRWALLLCGFRESLSRYLPHFCWIPTPVARI